MDLQSLESKFARRPQSPLFARLAEEYLSAGRLSEARDVCRRGLELFPDYISGRLLLAKCSIAEGDVEEAGRIIERIREQYPQSAVLKNLLIEWSSLAFVPTETTTGEMESLGGSPWGTSESVTSEFLPVVESPAEEVPGGPPPTSETAESLLTPQNLEDAIQVQPDSIDRPEPDQVTDVAPGEEIVSEEGSFTILSPVPDAPTLDVPVFVPEESGQTPPDSEPTAPEVNEEAEEEMDYFRSMLESVEDEVEIQEPDPATTVVAGPDEGEPEVVHAPLPMENAEPVRDEVVVEYVAMEEPAREDGQIQKLFSMPIDLPDTGNSGSETGEQPAAAEEIAELTPGPEEAEGNLPLKQTPSEIPDTVQIEANLSEAVPVIAQVPVPEIATTEQTSPGAGEIHAPHIPPGDVIPPEFQQADGVVPGKDAGVRQGIPGTGVVDENEEGRIVSRTLAQIYESQGEYAEALITYKLLLKRRPELAASLETKIAELTALMESRPGE